MRFWSGVLAAAVTVAAPAHLPVKTVTDGAPVVRVVETPVADSLVDWVEFDRQSECLWVFLAASGVELTLQTVVAAGDWTDALGGACLVIGEDDE